MIWSADHRCLLTYCEFLFVINEINANSFVSFCCWRSGTVNEILSFNWFIETHCICMNDNSKTKNPNEKIYFHWNKNDRFYAKQWKTSDHYESCSISAYRIFMREKSNQCLVFSCDRWSVHCQKYEEHHESKKTSTWTFRKCNYAFYKNRC